MFQGWRVGLQIRLSKVQFLGLLPILRTETKLGNGPACKVEIVGFDSQSVLQLAD
jgi:hypothetical protein